MPYIRIACNEDLETVYRFRYAIYVEEMRRPQKHANHVSKTICDPLDVSAAIVIAAWEGPDVVGTVRTNLLMSSDVFEYFEQYALSTLPCDLIATTSVTTRLMIHPRYRGTTLATRLSCEVYRVGLARGIEQDFIDCNSHLVNYFTHLGYRPHRSDLIHAEYGPVTVMRLDLHDVDHLERMRSPFARVRRRWVESQETVLQG